MRTKAQKIALFKSYFTGLMHVYGTYDAATGQVCQIKAQVTDQVVERHLRGRKPYGVYLLCKDRTAALAADFDDDNPEKPIEFVSLAKHYGLMAYLERSKSKGHHHAWLFTELPNVPAAKIRLVAFHILDEIGCPNTEVFPKQDCLDTNTRFGNFINAPLNGRWVPQGRTVFVNPNNALRPYPNQWDLLETIQRIPESLLDDIIETNVLRTAPRLPARTNTNAPTYNRTYGLPPCAQRMLAQGVTENQRVACFRLAIALKKTGLPYDATIAILTHWAPRNQPTDNKRVITETEIRSQTSDAYSKNYMGCGCETPEIAIFCSTDCAVWHRKNTQKDMQ